MNAECRITILELASLRQHKDHKITAFLGTGQIAPGVTSGGAQGVFQYGAKIDQFFIFDTGKLGL